MSEFMLCLPVMGFGCVYYFYYYFFSISCKKKKKKEKKKRKQERRPFGRVKGKNVTEYYRRDRMTYLKVNPKSEVVKCVSIAYHFCRWGGMWGVGWGKFHQMWYSLKSTLQRP
jgi:hypothetical protein